MTRRFMPGPFFAYVRDTAHAISNGMRISEEQNEGFVPLEEIPEDNGEYLAHRQRALAVASSIRRGATNLKSMWSNLRTHGKQWIREAYTATTTAISVESRTSSSRCLDEAPAPMTPEEKRQYWERIHFEARGENMVHRMAEDLFDRKKDEAMWQEEEWQRAVAFARKWTQEEEARLKKEAEEAIDCVLSDILDDALKGVEDDTSRCFISELADSSLTEASCVDLSTDVEGTAPPASAMLACKRC